MKLRGSPHADLSCSSVHSAPPRDDVEKPILTIKPKTIAGDEYAKAKTDFVIRIIPFIPPTAFKLDRLLPNKSNIHEASADAGTAPPPSGRVSIRSDLTVCDCSSVPDDETKAGQAEAATPHYNNAIIEDMLYQTHQKLIHEQLQNSPAIVDAILLFKVSHLSPVSIRACPKWTT